MYTDTVSPHSMGMKFAIEYYGINQVMYGSDYPCWDPATALKLIAEIGLSDADREKLFVANAQKFFRLSEPAKTVTRTPAGALA
jgi:aminocarboxymuconate-semialdehyde decarboxylase